MPAFASSTATRRSISPKTVSSPGSPVCSLKPSAATLRRASVPPSTLPSSKESLSVSSTSSTLRPLATARFLRSAGSLRAVSTVDALIALQGVENPAERKKRAVAKGRKALDVLDTLKLSLLDGSVDGSTLARLKVAAEGLSEQTGDPGLDTVLGEIDLRVAVELAKAGIR